MTREALANVDAGQVIDHQTVQAWADSLDTPRSLLATDTSLMELKWTSKALGDLARLHDFLASVNKPAAARAVQTLHKRRAD